MEVMLIRIVNTRLFALVVVIVEVLRCVVCSGGIPVTVTGTNLHVVQRPLMVIYAADGSESYSVCPSL
jgi:hypothetical protein